ncbi:centriolin isoform X1 [Scleropages formosus]|uniref:centriolin isoform X1 n=1 Tax=Scleropages formosus TaxID=113540 RepID=UPI0010FA6CDE|nr:centriolin isoform X1 [Scleropages formosus]
MTTAAAQKATAGAPVSGILSPDLRSRTPSPSQSPRVPITNSSLGSSSRIEAPEDCDTGALRNRGEPKSAGTRYITEALVKKLTQQENLAFVRSLNLSLSKSSGKKFKFIENLDKCERLQVLNLSHNLIEKIEKLEKLHKLHELNLSHNRIRKIEGLEHMGSLQLLNLANNNIEHVPPWLSRKLRSLQCLNLQHNNIFSLHEIVKLKSLKNLTELVLAENPVSNLPHYRLFLVFHLRALEKLDGLPVSVQERNIAHQRFHMEEVEHLEQELESQLAVIEKLREEQTATLQELEKQETLNRNLQLQNREQQSCQAQLERELETKNELLKRKTMELTRACQKQYELEQELAFHKIDAKFEPLPYYPDQELGEVDSPGESPYIGKARHKRNKFTPQPLGPEGPHLTSLGDTSIDAPEMHTPDRQNVYHAQAQAEDRLRQLHQEIESAEKQILRASTELHQLEEAVSQKRILEAEKEQLRQQLRRKMQQVDQLSGEAQGLEGQLEKQVAQMSQAQGEMDHLQSLLGTLDPSDPQHAHVKAQVSSKSQLLDMLSKRHHELEARLDHMLSRIAKETEEIKDLEQQLTDGQIAANEALKRDLEGIIAGLQEYLEGVKGQAFRAETECRQLQREKEALQRHLQDSEEQRNQLEMIIMDAEGDKEEKTQLQRELRDLRVENAELRQSQGQISAYKAKLEAQLQEHNAEVERLKEELGRMRRFSQNEQGVLQAELEKERHGRENALAQVELAVEKDKERQELQDQLRMLREENGSLRRQIHTLQRQLKEARATSLCPQEVTHHLEELIRSIASGAGEIRLSREEGALGPSLRRLQAELGSVVSAALADREEAASLREQLQQAQEEHKAAKAKVAEKRKSEMKILREELQEAQELQTLAQQRVQEAEEERDRLYAELEARDRKQGSEDCRTQQQLQSLDKELRDLKRSVAAADKVAALQLSDAKDQLYSMHGTVRKINKERSEDAEELEKSRKQAAAAAQALAEAEAEIQHLQRLLRDRELQQEHQADGSDQQQQELERLHQALSRQQAQTKRLWEQLTQAQQDKIGNLDELIRETEALKNSLAQQTSFMSTLQEPHGGRGCWYYVPSPPNPPSVGSHGTQDSGLGLQYPPSPNRGQRGRTERGQPAAPPARGYWLYCPPHHGHSGTSRRGEKHDSEGESDAGSSASEHHFIPPSGSAIYTVLPDGSPLPPGTAVYAPPAVGLSVSPGTVVCGPPPTGAPLVFGPPPSSLMVPLVHTGVLLCNMPGHQQMEKELRTLQEQARELRRKQRSEERVGANVQRLIEQRTDLEQEVQELRRAVSRLSFRREALQGDLTSLVGELELEKSLWQHEEVLEEVQCVEKTLMHRRAELREADRLLMEAESELKDAREKTRQTLQRHTEAQKHLEDTERELEEMEARAQDTATQLVQASQTLRAVQGELQVLQRHREEQEQTLLDMKDMVSSQDMKFQDLCSQVNQATERLEALMNSIQEAQHREAVYLGTLQELESMLSQRRSKLDGLSVEVALQQQEVDSLDRKLGQLREDERLLQDSVEQQRQSLAEVLQQGEEEAQDLRSCIKELRVDLDALSAQKLELGSQLAERRAEVSLLSEEALREEQALHSTLAQIDKHKTEMKHIQEMIQLENDKLQSIRQQEEEHQDQLEKSQKSLVQVHVELQDLQQAVQQREAQDERQRQLLGQEQKHLKALSDEMQGLKQQTQALEKHRNALKEQCRNLEARRVHAEKCLAVAEEGARVAEVELTRLEGEMERIKQEQRLAHKLKREMNRDAAAAQQQLEEKTQELNSLKNQLDGTKNELELLEEDVKAATERCEELRRQKEELQEAADSFQESKRKAVLLSQKLQELEDELLKRQAGVEQEDQRLQTLKQEAVEVEERQQQKLLKLQAQVRALEGALAERREKLERVTGSVAELEEQSRRLRRDQEQWTQLKNHLEQTERERQLRVQAGESRALRHELEECRKELQRLQEDLLTERRSQAELRAHSQAAEARAMEAEQELAKLQGNLATAEQEAQESHQRVRRLQKELSSMSQEQRSLKDKLRSHREGESRLREIKDTVRSLKTEVKAELSNGIRELEMPSSDASDTESHKENYPHFSTLRRAAFSAKDEQWCGDVLREKLRQQEDHLKAQLRRSMWSQEAALSQRRQQTEGTLQGLRRHVDRLDELLLNSSPDSMSLNHSEPPLKHGRPSTSQNWSLESSPVRLDPALPEKGPADRSW